MQNINKLLTAINSSNVDGIIKVFEDFANWHDPGGYIDDNMVLKYLTLECDEKEMSEL